RSPALYMSAPVLIRRLMLTRILRSSPSMAPFFPVSWAGLADPARKSMPRSSRRDSSFDTKLSLQKFHFTLRRLMPPISLAVQLVHQIIDVLPVEGDDRFAVVLVLDARHLPLVLGGGIDMDHDGGRVVRPRPPALETGGDVELRPAGLGLRLLE